MLEWLKKKGPEPTPAQDDGALENPFFRAKRGAFAPEPAPETPRETLPEPEAPRARAPEPPPAPPVPVAPPPVPAAPSVTPDIPTEAGTQESPAPEPVALDPGFRRDDNERDDPERDDPERDDPERDDPERDDGETVAPADAPVAVPATPQLPIEPAAAEPLPGADDAPERKSWFARLRDGLSKTTARLTDGISGIFTKRKLDDEALEELEELLIRADIGPTTAAKLTAGLAKTRFGKEVTPQEVRDYLAAELAKIVEPVARPLTVDMAAKPHIVLVVGVNGTGKTTTIGKLARQLRAEGKTVWLAAGDTFRAAAVSQLKIWGERTGCPVVARDTGADAAGLAYDAVEKARAAGADVLLIDTAGRLQNKQGLMDELRKVVRVIKKLVPDAPHTTLLTLDATTGQNAHSQVEIFRDIVGVDGLVLTKLDGSARGGVLVALAQKFGLPVHFIGVGEGVYDLRPFDPQQFARALVGVET